MTIEAKLADWIQSNREVEANAKLIAAAPEMAAELAKLRASNAELVAGCQAALAYLADPPSEFPENRAEAVRIINLALKEAK